jgi:DNA-binding transcriptional LysR family regulator
MILHPLHERRGSGTAAQTLQFRQCVSGSVALMVTQKGEAVKIESLREFIALTRYRSFRVAAERLFISQSTLSVHIAAMERELGFGLIEHNRNVLTLTPAGTMFLTYAQKIVDEYDEASKRCLEEASRRAVRIYEIPFRADVIKKAMSLSSVKPTFVRVPFGTGPLFALIDGTVDVCVSVDYSLYPDLASRARNAGVRSFPGPRQHWSIAVSSRGPFAKLDRLTRADIKGARINLAGLENYEEYRCVFEDILGPETHVDIRLSAEDSTLGVASADLGTSIHLCGSSAIEDLYKGRDDIKVFDELDGKPLEFNSIIAYRVPADDSSGAVEDFARQLSKWMREDAEQAKES